MTPATNTASHMSATRRLWRSTNLDKLFMLGDLRGNVGCFDLRNELSDYGGGACAGSFAATPVRRVRTMVLANRSRLHVPSFPTSSVIVACVKHAPRSNAVRWSADTERSIRFRRCSRRTYSV